MQKDARRALKRPRVGKGSSAASVYLARAFTVLILSVYVCQTLCREISIPPALGTCSQMSQGNRRTGK